MAPKNNNNKHPAADEPVELMEAIPEGLAAPGGEESPGAAEGSTYSPALRAGSALATTGGGPALDMEGVRPPYLSLVHGTSKDLIEKFNAGDLVLSKEFLAATKGQPMDTIILAIEQYWKERVAPDDWSAGVRPRIFRNKEDAKAQGLQVDWIGDTGPQAGPAMDMVLLVRKQEGVNCALYGVDVGLLGADGKPTEWAICLLSLDKSGYRVMLNDIANTIRFKLAKTGLFSALWELKTELGKPAQKTGNRVQIIRARFKAMLDPATVENIRSVMAVPVTTADGGGGDGDE